MFKTPERFLIANIFAVFDGRSFQQTVGIPMGICAFFLAKWFLDYYDAKFYMVYSRGTREKMT